MAYKYLQLEEYIKDRILTGNFKTGEKISSESELAKQFNLSRLTVRTAISNLVKSGLLYTVQGKGTYVAEGTSSKTKTQLIGFATMRFNDYSIFPKIIAGINSQTITEGYSLMISETQNTIEGEYSCLINFLEKGIDALIIDPCKSALPNPNLELYQEFAKREIPVVFYNGYRAELEYSYVIADDRQGGYLAAKHLLDYGHRKICAIFKMDDRQGHSRFHGFAQAYREYGLPVPEDNILWFSTEDYLSFWNGANGDSSKLDNLMMEKINKSTAMVAYNDYVTVKVLKLLVKYGVKCPDDFSIVSFDDTDLTSFSDVTITSILHPSLTMGEKLGAAILELFHQPSKIIRQIIPMNIVVRQSTKPVSS